MDNKVLVTINIPSLEKKYDIYIPVNKKIYSVIEMIKKCLFALQNGSFEMEKDYNLYDAETGNIYDLNLLVRNSDIRNGSEIILL